MSGGLGTKVQVRGSGVDEGGQNSGLFEDSLQSYLQSQFQEDSPVEPKPNVTNKTVQEFPSSGSETLNENGVKKRRGDEEGTANNNDGYMQIDAGSTRGRTDPRSPLFLSRAHPQQY